MSDTERRTVQAHGAPTSGRLVLADREAELLELKGPCSDQECRLHYAHRGPHDIRRSERQDVDRCPDCGKVPGKWQPTVSARRSELTLEECRTCGAAWTGRIGARG